MKFVRTLIQVFSLVACVACGPRAVPPEVAASPAANTAPWFSKELGISRPEDAAAAMTKAFDETVPVVRTTDMADTATATDCPSYFKLSHEGYSAVSDQEFHMLRMEGVRCHALRLGATLKPFAGAPGPQFATAENALDLLPASVGGEASPTMIEARQASARRGETWRTYAKNASVTSRDGMLVVDEGDLISELTQLAAGDLDGDHQPEFLVRAVSYGREGSWQAIHLVVLKRKPNQARFGEPQTITP